MGFAPGFLHPSGALLVDDSGLISQAPGLLAFAYANGLKLNNAGQLVTKLGGTPHVYNNGLPVTVDGELCVSYLGIGTVTPTLSFNFMTPGVLDPKITFTCTTVRTYYNSAGDLATSAINEPRWQWDPITHELKGLLVEYSTTNQSTNNTYVGGAPGSPGTSPNGWTLPGNANGIGQTIMGFGQERGVDYMDIRFSGTPVASTPLSLAWITLNGIGSTQVQIWQPSCYMRLMGGSLSGAVLNMCICGIDAGNVIQGDVAQVLTPTGAPLVTQRFNFASNISSIPTATKVFPRFRVDVQAGVPIDFTLRIGLTQFEGSSNLTMPKRTIAANITNGFEVLKITDLSWFTQGVGTVVYEWTSVGNPTGYCWEFQGPTNADLIRSRDITTTLDAGVTFGGAIQATSSVTTGPRTIDTINSSAASWGTGSLTVANNGVAGTTLAPANIPTNLATLNLGTIVATNNSPLGGYLRKWAYIPQLTPRDQLIGITENTFHVGGVLVGNSSVRIINA